MHEAACNLAVTGLSVAVALRAATMELLGLVGSELGLHDGGWRVLRELGVLCHRRAVRAGLVGAPALRRFGRIEALVSPTATAATPSPTQPR